MRSVLKPTALALSIAAQDEKSNTTDVLYKVQHCCQQSLSMTNATIEASQAKRIANTKIAYHVYLTSTYFGQCSGSQKCLRMSSWTSIS